MKFPKMLRPFYSKAREMLEKGLVRDIEFSGKTYQVQVFDEKTGRGFWSFIQLNDKGSIQDAFCDCPEEGGCVHEAAGFLSLYGSHRRPLHERFEKSIWKGIATLFQGYTLRYKGGGVYETEGGELKIEGKEREARTHLEGLIALKIEETEETSLKFSNLSDEEIEEWKEGNPSPFLQFELSYWADLAKWWMLLQDRNEPYHFTFEGTIPTDWKITFPQVEMSLHLTQEQLEDLLPKLQTVSTDLVVYSLGETEVEKMHYIPESGELQVISRGRKEEVALKTGGIQLEHWIYMPQKGFYPLERQDLFAKPVLTGTEIEIALNEHTSFMQRALEGVTVHEESVRLKYTLHFDEEWNLHLSGYFIEKGDLCKGTARRFGEWIYLPDQGFYHLSDHEFEQLEMVIPTDQVTHFIRKHRIWLNAQEGFHAYVSKVEAKYTYHVSDRGQLILTPQSIRESGKQRVKDFGSWVYIEGEGFYSKVSSSLHLPPEASRPIPKDQVDRFIREYEGELQLIPGFFLEEKVTQGKLIVKLGENGLVHVSPKYDVEGNVTLYGNYFYVEGKGFGKVLADWGIPEAYRHPRIISEKLIGYFLTEELPHIKGEIDPRLHLIKEAKLSIELLRPVDGGYELKGSYLNVPVTDLWYSGIHHKRFHFSTHGAFDLMDEHFSWLKLIPKERGDRRTKKLQLTTLDLIRLSFSDTIERHSSFQDILDGIMSFKVPYPPPLDLYKGNLRPYQQKGVDWLWFLYTHRLSGLLCDDMGLGKTHQVMALMGAIMAEKKAPKMLVICPTSVIFHWEDRLAEFLPDASVCTYHGSKRSFPDLQNESQILLTSYGIWRKEQETLAKVPFDLAVFDEIQMAKNMSSRIHKALSAVQAGMRVGLTGTPIENALPELKALFDLVLPSYMPSERVYREEFTKPIQELGDVKKRAKLTRMIRPFVLRRKKDQVLKDLPEKTEEIAHCPLSEEQEVLYREVLDQARQVLIPELEDEQEPVPYLHIFSLLSQLKQICNHPAAYYKRPFDYKKYTSGKWDLFCELLAEARGSDQKVVVFSQYLVMLDIIEAYLHAHHIQFSRLRGETQNRAEQIKRFNNDPNCTVFVGSLHAAGLGVDLTAGSVVIHYDRWWNAARENQATDRVHRIGQTRGVQVFKMVTKGTFEEKIDLMIARKGKLMEQVVSSDDHRIVKQFNREELLELLS